MTYTPKQAQLLHDAIMAEFRASEPFDLSEDRQRQSLSTIAARHLSDWPSYGCHIHGGPGGLKLAIIPRR